MFVSLALSSIEQAVINFQQDSPQFEGLNSQLPGNQFLSNTLLHYIIWCDFEVLKLMTLLGVEMFVQCPFFLNEILRNSVHY